MEKIKNVIEEIKINPVLFLGKYSLELFSFYLSAYDHACHKLINEQTYFNTYFQYYVEMKYKLKFCSKHWSRILSEKCSTEEEAFELFYHLFDSMYIEWSEYFHENLFSEKISNIVHSFKKSLPD